MPPASSVGSHPRSGSEYRSRALLKMSVRRIRSKAPSTTMLVRAKVVEQLPAADAQRVSRALNTSLRSLQRRLAQEGTSFKEILDEARHQLAVRYVRDSELPLREITGRLGFSDPGNFARAFRRWEGVSPNRYRRSA